MTGATCSYEGIVKEIHYTASVSPGTNEVKAVIADVVYAKYLDQSCTAFKASVKKIFSFTFKDSNLS